MIFSNIRAFLILVVVLLFPSNSVAITPQEILNNVVKQQNIDRSMQRVSMYVHTKSGQVSEYKFELYLRKENDILYSYTRFTHPVEVANTQVVLIEDPSGSDTQLFYLPALQKTNQISGKMKSRPFMGSDFSFSDLEVYVSTNDTHKIIEESEENWVIATTSTSHTQYSQWHTTVNKNILIPINVRYFDKNSQPIKELSVDEYKQIDGKTVPMITTMTSIQKGTKTILRIDDIQLNISNEEIPLEMFSAECMEKR